MNKNPSKSVETKERAEQHKEGENLFIIPEHLYSIKGFERRGLETVLGVHQINSGKVNPKRTASNTSDKSAKSYSSFKSNTSGKSGASNLSNPYQKLSNF